MNLETNGATCLTFGTYVYMFSSVLNRIRILFTFTGKNLSYILLPQVKYTTRKIIHNTLKK